MSTLTQNANRIKGGAGKIKSLLLAEGQNADHIEGYADLLAECLVDAPSEQSWQGERVTAQGAEIDKGIALLSGIKGKSVKVCQFVSPNPSSASETEYTNGVKITYSGNDVIVDVAEGGCTAYRQIDIANYHWQVIGASGHKRLFCGAKSTTSYIGYHTGYNEIATNTIIESDANAVYILLRVLEGCPQGRYILTPMVLDLTLMGLESCTSSAEVAKALGYASVADMPYIPYTEGSLIISHPSKIVSKGRNLWDEETELGYIDPTNGVETISSTCLRMKNYIPILPNTTYYKTTPQAFWNVYYDADKAFVGYGSPSAGAFTTPSNAYYLRSGFEANYGTTYNHDIAIIKGSSGEYTPYLEDEVAISLPSLFSDGIKSVGNIADEWTSKVVKRCGMVKLKELSWSYISSIGRFDASIAGAKGTASNTSPANILCSRYPAYPGTEWEGSSFCIVKESPESDTRVFVKDSRYTSLDAFVAALTDNDVLIYELATAIEQETPFPKPYYKVEHHGTETALATSRNILPSLIDAFIGYEDYDIVANLASAWGIEVGKIGKRVFDGTESWSLAWVAHSSTNHEFQVNPADAKPTDQATKANLACNGANTIAYNSIINKTDEGTACSIQSQGLFDIYDSRFTSVDAWKSHLAHLYNIGCPLTIYYEKA